MRRGKKTYHQQEKRDKDTVSYLRARLLTSQAAHKALCSPQALDVTCNLKEQEPFPLPHNRLLRIKRLPTFGIAHQRRVCWGLNSESPVSERPLHIHAEGLWKHAQRSRSPLAPGCEEGKESQCLQLHLSRNPWLRQRKGLRGADGLSLETIHIALH